MRALTSMGFAAREEQFEYSQLPGRFGTPVAGAMLALAVLAATAMRASPSTTLVVLFAGCALTLAFARSMLGDAVLDLPYMRARSVNVVATRGQPRVWLVAHLDSKSQPVPTALRVLGMLLLASGVAVSLVAAGLSLSGAPVRTVWWIATGVTLFGALPVMASTVENHSHGAVDNASGVAAVLRAAALVSEQVEIGILLPGAEELGLAGARAWARENAPVTALNCDGVDDNGQFVLMYSGAYPFSIAAAAASVRPVHVRRMLPGILTDSVALAARGSTTATFSRGSLRTLVRIHTGADSLANLRGDSIDEMATLLARCAEELSQ